MRTTTSLLAFAFAGLLSGAALGLTQPDNTPIPQGAFLQSMFDARGESINALADAVTLPETFIPHCELQFEVLARNAGYLNSFGWYNVTGQKPSPAELFGFLACNDGVGTVRTLAIKSDPNYAGGEVGFYQAAGPQACPPGPIPSNNQSLFYSQKGYNPDGTQQNPYIHLLIYNSTVVPNAFYFCWEDLLVGGDNDFDDLVTFVTGITCSGGGAACQTGQLGICADGTMQCQNGQLTCLPLSEPASEACDGLDNDCNGETDEGDICPTDEVCDEGSCVPLCSGGEYPCPPNEVCNGQGLCVDPDCIDANCPSGTKCIDGACVAPCDGVTCPYGQICLVGVCMDPCSKITCDQGQVCELGVCKEHCDCLGCLAGESCQPSGLCLLDDCVGVDCPPGSHCGPGGACVDDCEGAACPTGQICEVGECVSDPGAGGSGTGGGTIDIGGGGASSSSSGSGGAGGSSSGVGGSGGAANDGAIEGGCGCRQAGAGDRRPWSLLMLAALAALAASRRRRRPGRGRPRGVSPRPRPRRG